MYIFKSINFKEKEFWEGLVELKIRLFFDFYIIWSLFATQWTVAHQAPLSMGFSRQELEWVAVSFSRGPSHPGIESGAPELQAGFFANWAIRKAQFGHSSNTILIGIITNQNLHFETEIILGPITVCEEFMEYDDVGVCLRKSLETLCYRGIYMGAS